MGHPSGSTEPDFRLFLGDGLTPLHTPYIWQKKCVSASILGT